MRKSRGFTLIELVIVVALVAVLAALITLSLFRFRQKAKLARVSAELTDIAKAVTQYAEDNNYQYPADVGRAVPPGLERYLANGTWPESIWPNGVFDWDRWTYHYADPSFANGRTIYQITYRLCDLGDPVATCRDPVLFPDFVQMSGIFYCISGPCVPHENFKDVTPPAPGYCVNCKDKDGPFPLPGT